MFTLDGPLEKLAINIDFCVEKEDSKSIFSLIGECESKLKSSVGIDRPILYFFQSNCYSGLAQIDIKKNFTVWEWHQKDRISEILCLRKAILEESFVKLDPVFKSKIYTNLGCSLSRIGRFVEAINYWDKALSIIPNLAMALGNRGECVLFYGKCLYDRGHSVLLIEQARKDLHSSLSNNAFWDSGLQEDAFESFTSSLNSIIDNIGDPIHLDNLDDYSLGKSKKEVRYRKWCLENKLFLCPLNDIYKQSIAAHDILHLPDHVYKVGEKPRFPNYYNLLKQEYIAARYMLFESMNTDFNHIADNDVLLIDGYDGAFYGYRNQQLNVAYRLTYSIFDKVALFLNDYFSVGMRANSVNFRRIWGSKNNNKFILNSIFKDNENWPLRGLYYLSKDFFDSKFSDTSMPEAKSLDVIRNRAEHRFLSLQHYGLQVDDTDIHSYIEISDFREKALKMLSMAREALIYLSLAVHREEYLRNLQRKDDDLIVPILSEEVNR